MTDVETPRWADAGQTAVRVVSPDRQTWIPADPGNADYAALVEAATDVAPFRRFATLEQARASLEAAVEAEAARRRAVAVGTTDPAKLAVYQWKAEIVADGDDQLGALAAEAAARGIAPTYLAALIRAKAIAWRQLGLAIDAATAVHKAAIAALPDLAAAEGYDVAAGWPSD